jgi:hypothetical protein
MKPSTHTLHNGSLVPNEEVVEKMKELISGPYNAYGYQSIHDDLRALGYLINHKKTYRLMDFHKLLLGKVIRTSGKRNWVQYRKILANQPLEYLCLDIKYVWVQGEGRWYYLLSIMDVFSRKILHWIFQKSVRKMDVINMFRWLHTVYNLNGVIIRNDNGSQFLANQVRSFLIQLEAGLMNGSGTTAEVVSVTWPSTGSSTAISNATFTFTSTQTFTFNDGSLTIQTSGTWWITSQTTGAGAGTWNVIAGTGSYAKVKGSGTLTISEIVFGVSVTDTYTGTLQY